MCRVERRGKRNKERKCQGGGVRVPPGRDCRMMWARGQSSDGGGSAERDQNGDAAAVKAGYCTRGNENTRHAAGIP